MKEIVKPSNEMVIIGRLRKKIAKLQEQRDSYKSTVELYRTILDTHPYIERKYKSYLEHKKEVAYKKDLETRCQEQAKLIRLLEKQHDNN